MEVQRKVLKEVTLKLLQKETYITFSEPSIDLLYSLIDEYADGNEKDVTKLVSKFSKSDFTKKILTRGLEIYKKEYSK